MVFDPLKGFELIKVDQYYTKLDVLPAYSAIYHMKWKLSRIILLGIAQNKGGIVQVYTSDNKHHLLDGSHCQNLLFV